MGNLVTKGKAVVEYEAESMKLKVIFKKEGKEAGCVLKSVRNLCENFLEELVGININPESIQLIDGGVNSRYSADDNMVAERTIVIETKIDIALCTYIFSIIEKYDNEVTYSIRFDVFDKSSKRNELLKQAVMDSRRQADIIAASLGKTISGVISVNDNEYIPEHLAKAITVDGEDINPKIPEAFKSDTPLSDRAALPKVLMTETITISWNMNE